MLACTTPAVSAASATITAKMVFLGMAPPCSVEGVDPDRLEIRVGERVLRLVVRGVAVDLDRLLRSDDCVTGQLEGRRIAPASRREPAGFGERAPAADGEPARRVGIADV